MATHRLTIEITDEALAEARHHYPSTFPRREPPAWNSLDLRRALDFATGSFRIVGYSPAWEPGLDRVTGMACHPSMQRMTADELRARFHELERERAEAASFSPSRDQRDLYASITLQRKAILLALEWRGVAL